MAKKSSEQKLKKVLEYNIEQLIPNPTKDSNTCTYFYKFLEKNQRISEDGQLHENGINYHEGKNNPVHRAYLGKTKFYRISTERFEEFVKENCVVNDKAALKKATDSNGNIMDAYFAYLNYPQEYYDISSDDFEEVCCDYGRSDFVNRKANNLYLYENDDQVFLYDSKRKTIYNTNSGFVEIDTTMSLGYVYFPVKAEENFFENYFTASLPMLAMKSFSADKYLEMDHINSVSGENNAIDIMNSGDFQRSFNAMFSGFSVLYENYNAVSYANFEATHPAADFKESFNYYKENMKESSDIYILKDGEKFVSQYKNSKGKFVDFDYFPEDKMTDIMGSGIDFVITYNEKFAESKDDYHMDFIRFTFEVAKAIKHPYVTFAVSFLVLLLMIILLTVNAGKSLFIDKVPLLILVAIPAILYSIMYYIFVVNFEMQIEEVMRISQYSNLKLMIIWCIVICVTVVYFTIAILYLTCVRRIKNKDYKKNIFYKFFAWLHRKFRETVENFRVVLESQGLKYQLVKLIVPIVIAYLLALALILVFVNYHIMITLCSFMLVTVLAAFFLAEVIGLVSGMKKIESKTEMISNMNFTNDGEDNSEGKNVAKTLPITLRKTYGNLEGISDSFNNAVLQATKDERTKAELITNVSHDIKTPLTSIISYVDLIKREESENPKIVEYADVLSVKAERLKVLISDLVEASKTDTGNIEIEFTNMNLNVLASQVMGEFYEKFEEKNLNVITTFSDEAPIISADGRHMYRVLENIFQNVYKYALEGTRVYFSVIRDESRGKIKIDLKNISKNELNISPDELTERFVRGDKSRTTEGSGLGLSIAKNLTTLMNGSFDIKINGDLFEISIEFDAVGE